MLATVPSEMESPIDGTSMGMSPASSCELWKLRKANDEVFGVTLVRLLLNSLHR